MSHSLPIALAILAPLSTPSFATNVVEIRWEAHTSEAADGTALAGRVGRIAVPERHDRPDGPKIEIAFVVFESKGPKPGPPIVYLAGGPGASGIEHCVREATDPRLRLLDHADVIGVDQRGTGRSLPDLADPLFEYELPTDRPVGREEVARAFRDASARAAAHWKAKGVDLSAYNTLESAHDVDDVRRALGLEKLVLWGESYGSHLGLAYLREHGEHVARAVLLKVEGPDHTFKLPSTLQRCLDRLRGMVARDPALHAELPDLAATVRGLLAKLASDPVVLTRAAGGEEMRVAIGPYDLQRLIATGLASSTTMAGLPAALALMEQGHWDVMFGFALKNRRGDIQSAMSVAMDCASGASAPRKARIERELADGRNLLADALDAPFLASACDAVPARDLGTGFRSGFSCKVPVLFVSGALDARTPPENVDEIRGGFSDHAHLVVDNTGHDARELESPEYCRLVHAFLAGERVESRTIEMPPVPFRPIQRR